MVLKMPKSKTAIDAKKIPIDTNIAICAFIINPTICARGRSYTTRITYVLKSARNRQRRS